MFKSLITHLKLSQDFYRITVASAFVFYAVPASATQIHACVNRSIGLVRIVTPTNQCMPREIKLSWNQQGPAGAPGAAGTQGPAGSAGAAGAPGPQGPAGAGALVVRDANGATIGTLISQNTIVMTVGTQKVQFNNFQSTGFATTPSPNVLFLHTSSDCSGQRYLSASDLPRLGAIDVTQTVYYAENPIGSQLVASYESFSPSQPLSQPGHCNTLSPAQNFVMGPATTSPLPTFTTPFQL